MSRASTGGRSCFRSFSARRPRLRTLPRRLQSCSRTSSAGRTPGEKTALESIAPAFFIFSLPSETRSFVKTGSRRTQGKLKTVGCVHTASTPCHRPYHKQQQQRKHHHQRARLLAGLMTTQSPQRQRARATTLMETRLRSTSSAGLRPHHRQSSPRSVSLQHGHLTPARLRTTLTFITTSKRSTPAAAIGKYGEHVSRFVELVLSLCVAPFRITRRLHGLWLRLMHRVRHAPRLRRTRRMRKR
jgi:hypothetical protein